MAALLKTPIDVNARQADGATALHWAAHWDDLQVADALIRAGARVNAANDSWRDADCAGVHQRPRRDGRQAVEGRADANSKRMTGETALMTCARSGNADAVKALLAHGADVRAAENETGQTALMWAAAQGHAETAQALSITAPMCTYVRSVVYAVAVFGSLGRRRDRARAVGGGSRRQRRGAG